MIKQVKIVLLTVLCTVLTVTSVTAVAALYRRPIQSPPSSSPSMVEPHKGDMSMRGGTATVRESYVPQDDDPETTNDETNDQAIGHFGTKTIYAHNLNSGNSYPLDADVDDGKLERLYFPKGGWVDLPDCDLDVDSTCTDENGTNWDIDDE